MTGCIFTEGNPLPSKGLTVTRGFAEGGGARFPKWLVEVWQAPAADSLHDSWIYQISSRLIAQSLKKNPMWRLQMSHFDWPGKTQMFDCQYFDTFNYWKPENDYLIVWLTYSSPVMLPMLYHQVVCDHALLKYKTPIIKILHGLYSVMRQGADGANTSFWNKAQIVSRSQSFQLFYDEVQINSFCHFWCDQAPTALDPGSTALREGANHEASKPGKKSRWGIIKTPTGALFGWITPLKDHTETYCESVLPAESQPGGITRPRDKTEENKRGNMAG